MATPIRDRGSPVPPQPAVAATAPLGSPNMEDDDEVFPGLNDLLASPRADGRGFQEDAIFQDEPGFVSPRATPAACTLPQSFSSSASGLSDADPRRSGLLSTPPSAVNLHEQGFNALSRSDDRAASSGFKFAACASTPEPNRIGPGRLFSGLAPSAVKAHCEELNGLREENDSLRDMLEASQREVARLRRRAEADQEEIREYREYLDVERCRCTALEEELLRRGGPRAKTDTLRGSLGKRKLAPGLETAARPGDENDLAKSIVAMELKAFESVEGEEDRARLRRQIQMKWHPDKNSHNADFATRVLQEMNWQAQWQ